MTQELINLRTSILEGRYTEALAIVDELEGMSKQAILRNIEFFLVGLLIHWIKNQVEQRLTNSWVGSISDSVRQIQTLNLKDNKTHYIKQDEWQPLFEEALADAVHPESVEVMNGVYRPSQLSQMINKSQIILTAKQLIDLTYIYPAVTLLDVIDTYLIQLPGAKDWQES